MYRHRHLIKDLTVITDLRGLENPFPNLRTLSISLADRQQLSLDLITMAPSLVTVEFSRVELTPATWLAVSAHSQIKNFGV